MAVTIFFSVFSNTAYTQIDEQKINEEIDSLLKEKASIMLSNENVLSKNALTSRSTTILKNKQRNELEEIYSKFKTTNINDEKRLFDAIVSVQIKAVTSLTIAKTRCDAKHEFILEKTIKSD